MIPETPIVITASIEGAEGKEAPWFGFRVNIDNQSDQTIELVALQLDITGQGNGGQLTTATVAFDPSQADFTLNDLQCEYTTFGTWGPGIKRDIGVIAHGLCPGGGLQFFTGGNPKGPNGNNFRYRVKAKPLGYFIDSAGNPDDRFEKFKYFFTK